MFTVSLLLHGALRQTHTIQIQLNPNHAFNNTCHKAAGQKSGYAFKFPLREHEEETLRGSGLRKNPSFHHDKVPLQTPRKQV